MSETQATGAPAVSPTTSPAAEEAPQFFRGAKAGQPVHFNPSPNEFKVDPDGFVKPTHGVSVFDNPDSVLSKGYEPYELDPESVPDELQIIQRGNDPSHHEIVPSQPGTLTPADFARLLQQIKTK